MTISESLKQLRDDLKLWVTNNLVALNTKIEMNTVPIDTALDNTSTNPVQNKAITEELDKLSAKIEDGGFTGEYEDIPNAPTISNDESESMMVTDDFSNIIFEVNQQGIHTTNVTINGKKAATEVYVDEAIANITINDADLDLTNYYTKSETDNTIDQKVNATKEDLSESIDSNSNEFVLIDTDGNIIASVTVAGMQTTLVRANEMIIGDMDVATEIATINQNSQNLSSRITVLETYPVENWTFMLEDGSTVIKKVVLN